MRALFPKPPSTTMISSSAILILITAALMVPGTTAQGRYDSPAPAPNGGAPNATDSGDTSSGEGLPLIILIVIAGYLLVSVITAFLGVVVAIQYPNPRCLCYRSPYSDLACGQRQCCGLYRTNVGFAVIYFVLCVLAAVSRSFVRLLILLLFVLMHLLVSWLLKRKFARHGYAIRQQRDSSAAATTAGTQLAARGAPNQSLLPATGIPIVSIPLYKAEVGVAGPEDVCQCASCVAEREAELLQQQQQQQHAAVSASPAPEQATLPTSPGAANAAGVGSSQQREPRPSLQGRRSSASLQPPAPMQMVPPAPSAPAPSGAGAAAAGPPPFLAAPVPRHLAIADGVAVSRGPVPAWVAGSLNILAAEAARRSGRLAVSGSGSRTGAASGASSSSSTSRGPLPNSNSDAVVIRPAGRPGRPAPGPSSP